MLVTEYLNVNSPIMLTKEMIAELDEAAKHSVVYDDECPPMTEEQVQRALEYLRKRQRKIA